MFGGGGGEGALYNVPRFVSMSTTSSLFTNPSLSRSRIWNPSRISRTWAAGNFDSASPFTVIGFAVLALNDCGAPIAVAVLLLELRVGESGGSRAVRRDGVRPRGVQLPEVEGGVAALLWSLWGDEARGVWWALVGDVVGVGVVGRLAGEGEGEEGDSGRRKGEAGDSGRLKGEVRGEP